MGHSPNIQRAKAHFSLNLCSRCVDCSLIIVLHIQADLHTLLVRYLLSGGCPVWSRRILTMRQSSLPLSEVVPGVRLYANRTVDLEPVSSISRVIFCPGDHGQVSSPSKYDETNARAV